MPTIYSRRHPKFSSLGPNEFVVLKIGVSNKNGRIYEESVIDSAVFDYNMRNAAHGFTFGVFMDDARSDGNGNIDITKITHKTDGVWRQGDKLISKITPLDTPQGKVLQHLLALDLVEFRTAGTCSHLENGCVRNWTLISVNAVMRGKGA
jgi:hypothetical protein